MPQLCLSRQARQMFRALFVFIPVILALGSLNATVFSVPSAPNAICGGTVYRDFDADGTRDAGEPGVAGVTVTAYDAAGVVASGVSGSSGAYAMTIPDGTSVRIEFTALPGGSFSGPFGADAGTTVTFVDTTNCSGVDLGISVPGQYCQANPDLATSCYIGGDQTGIITPVIVGFPYSAGGTSLPAIDNPPTHTFEVPGGQAGTTWGLAWRPSSQSLFAAAFMKRHSGFGPGGTGAIYLIDTNTGAASPFVNLNTLFGPGTAGIDTHPPDDTTCPNGSECFDIDQFSWDAVGKISLGDIDISEDEQTLWAVNLNDRQLYRIPIGTPPVTPTAGSIGRYAIPFPTDCPDAVTNTRPFATGIHDGLVYVGSVCSAETTQIVSDTRAYVYSFDPSSLAFTQVLSFSLNYPRGCAIRFGPNCDSAAWRPWVTTFTVSPTFFTTNDEYIYPQPWLTDIVFDNDDMILGLRDRFADQMGFLQRSTNPSDTALYSGDAAGDILRACSDGAGGWVLESNATCGGVGPTNPMTGTGPGMPGGEYYFQENYPYHDEVSLGGLAQVPGFPDVVETMYDPVFSTTEEFDGGILWANNDTGARTKTYRIFGRGTNDPLTFGKAGGLGDLEALCSAAPIEIGNRVWLDQNRNGIQDAETATGVITPELPIAGVTVRLYAPDGVTLLAQAVTDARGEYYFSSAPGTSSANAIYGIAGLTFNTTGFIIRLDNPANYAAGGPLENYALTFADVSSGPNSDIRDSDGSLPVPANPIGPGNYPQVMFNTGPAGDNNHTYDFGFFLQPTAVELLYFRVDGVSGQQVDLAWATAVEIDNFGFNLYRASESDFGRAELIHFEPSSIGGSGSGAVYAYADTVPADGVWWYWLADLDTQGHETLHGPVSAVVGPDAILPYRSYLPMVSKAQP